MEKDATTPLHQRQRNPIARDCLALVSTTVGPGSLFPGDLRFARLLEKKDILDTRSGCGPSATIYATHIHFWSFSVCSSRFGRTFYVTVSS